MKILLLNPPLNAPASRFGTGEQIPLGLLSIGGPLLDAGHQVQLLDSEARRLSIPEICAEVARHQPDWVMTGHAGSMAAHPTVVTLATALKQAVPHARLVYGGVYPTYHGEEILAQVPVIDLIVRGEGERTALRVVNGEQPWADIPGLFYREHGKVQATPPAEMITDLDEWRVGWELIEDWDRYQCWGLGRAAIIQLSRGCPHQCRHCGQHGFWTRWRYRTPEKLAAEIAWLHHTHGIRFVNLADENPTSSPRVWRRFLEALIAENLPIKLFTSLRASDIVRDADLLPLYKQAGLDCILVGVESTDEATLRKIGKKSTPRQDVHALRLLRQHRILSLAGYIVDLENAHWRDFWTAFHRLRQLDPDMLSAMYATPHRWTSFYTDSEPRAVIQADLSKWDYRHQVLAHPNLRPWQLFWVVKCLEIAIHLRPRALYRLGFYPDPQTRRALRWCTRRITQVWFHDIIRVFLAHSPCQSRA